MYEFITLLVEINLEVAGLRNWLAQDRSLSAPLRFSSGVVWPPPCTLSEERIARRVDARETICDAHPAPLAPFWESPHHTLYPRRTRLGDAPSRTQPLARTMPFRELRTPSPPSRTAPFPRTHPSPLRLAPRRTSL